MPRLNRPAVGAVFLLLILLSATAQAALDQRLAAFAPFVDKTWRGEVTGGDGAEPMIDVQRWETALGGKAVRIVHSLNDGDYGGETMMFWDSATGGIIFYYFTTGGFYTHGTVEVLDDGFSATEIVVGSEDGITEVRSHSRVLPDGRLHGKARYLKHGEWVDGHEFYYNEAPDAEVRFR